MLQQEPIKEPDELNEELNSELVFFDTFSHDNNEEINLDLVQFRNPVLIKEIRIIPLGAKVEADFAGGWRLGATNPSSFDVLFYINDLTKTTLNKFTKFGNFEYKESVNIKFVPNELKPTDSLVLKGKYTILTLAVFAELVNENSIKTDELLSSSNSDQKVNESEQNYENNDYIHIENDTLQSISESCSSKNENFERLNNGKEISANEIKLIEDEDQTNQNKKLEREIQPISSPTNDNNLDFEDESTSTKHLPIHLESIKDSESISSIEEEIKNESVLQTTNKENITNVNSALDEQQEENTNDSDLEPISPDQNDQPIETELNKQLDNLNEQPTTLIKDDLKIKLEQQQNQNVDLLYISNLTEKVSDDEMCDFNNEFDTNNENSINQHRLGSRASTANSEEDLEAISSEEEYFEEVAGSPNDGELFVDYSDDEIHQINFINEFNSTEYTCRPLKSSLEDPSFSNYENLKLRNKFKESNELVNEIIYFNKQDKDSKWIEFIENLDLNLINLDREDLSEILIDWVKIGIDFELALNQQNTVFKVRQLKAGLKLLSSIVQTNSSKLINQLLLNERILLKIYKLFFKPFMTFPIKLLLIRTLDLFTDNSEVVDHFLNFKYELDNEFNQNLKENLKENLESTTNEQQQQQENEFKIDNNKFNLEDVFTTNKKTIYQLLLILMMKTNVTRVTVALTILLRKIHFYEFLVNFKEDSQLLLLNNNNSNYLKEQEQNRLINNLNELIYSFKQSKQLFGQRLRYLPARIQFDVKPSLSNIIYALYRWFNKLEFLNLICDLLSKFKETKTTNEQQLVNSILNFLNEILLEENGSSYYLSSKVYEITNHLLEITNKSNQLNGLNGLNGLNDEELKENEVKLLTFNENLKYNLYILELIDQINEIQLSDDFKINEEESELCLLFNKLYSMTFNKLGSRCLIKQLIDNHNLDILVKFLIYNKERNDKTKLISFHYAINLLIYTIQHSREQLCELLIKYYDEFIQLSNYSSILSKWLAPLKKGLKFNYNESTFKLLVSNLKQHSERLKDLKENCTYRVSPDLICCVQILHYLCIDPNQLTIHQHQQQQQQQQQSSTDQLLPNNQLKFKYGLIQLFTLKGQTYILTILERLAEIFLKPSHLNSSLIGNQGYYLITLFKPCLDILKQTLLNLTHCRGSDFKDTSPIKPLLKVYSLMLVYPLNSSYHLNSIQLCNEVIIILHSYTQLNVNINEVEDEVFNKSIWTKMVKEVIDFTILKPFNFSHGLYLLSQLLPLPLNVKEIEDQNEVTRLLNFRKLWSAHIHVLFSDIENMLQKLVICLSPLIQYLLRRICYQLVDLSSHAGVIISKCLLSVLDQHLQVNSIQTTTITTTTTKLIEQNENLISVLDLISFLLKYNLFKNSFSCTVNTLNSSIKKDEKLDKTIRKTIELFKSNDELLSNYTNILDVLESKELSKQLVEDEQQLDLTHMEKLNLLYNQRIEFNFEDNSLDELKLSMNSNRKSTQYDLLIFIKKYLSNSNFDVRNQLMVIYKNEEPNYEENYKLANKHKHEPLITKDKDYSGNVKRRPYVAPLRGRGFQRGSNNNLGRLHDPFRSRPPNTSRPPSMHVDEYEKQAQLRDFGPMDSNQQQNIKRQKQDFNKFNKLNQVNQRNMNPNMNRQFNYNNYRPLNNRMNNLNNNRNTFNRYNNLQSNYNNNGINQQNKLRKQFNNDNNNLNQLN